MRSTLFLFAALFAFCTIAVAQEGQEGGFAAAQLQRNNQDNKDNIEYKYERPKWVRIDRSQKKSYDRTDGIQKIVERYVHLDGQKLTDYIKQRQYHTAQKELGACLADFTNECQKGELWKSVENAIVKELKLNLTPVGSPLSASRENMPDSLKEDIRNKFPRSLADIRKEAEKKARKAFPVYEPGKRVTVSYRKGRRSYTVRGIYHGMGPGGTIQVGRYVISLRDLDSKLLSKFYEQYNKKAREEMVEKDVDAYRMARFTYEKKKVDEIMDSRRVNNERNGFVYYPVLDDAKFRSALPEQNKNLQEKKKQLSEKLNNGTITEQERSSYMIYGWVTPEKIAKELIAHVANTVKLRLQQAIPREKALEAERVRLQQEAEKAKQQNQNQDQNQNEEEYEEEEE